MMTENRKEMKEIKKFLSNDIAHTTWLDNFNNISFLIFVFLLILHSEADDDTHTLSQLNKFYGSLEKKQVQSSS